MLDLLTLPDCIDAVERAFRLHAEGRTLGPGGAGVSTPADGGFHIKAAGLLGERSYFAAKTNANFPDNPRRFGLPTIQGTVVLADAGTGQPLAVMDSGSVTALRTGAATAVAAKFLARPDARTATHRRLRRPGRDPARGASPPSCHCSGPGSSTSIRPAPRPWPPRASATPRPAGRSAVRISAPRFLASDVCVTCTPARRAFVTAADVAPGTFIAAVGADNRGKQELDPSLVASATVVVDVLDQCAEIGELQHVLAAGLMTREQVHAELADVVAGRRPGRTRREEITIFDSSGTALQDVAAAVAVYEKARVAGRGTEVKLDG